MSEREILKQLQDVNARIERIAKAINELPHVIDGKLKILNENQRVIIERFNTLEEIISAYRKTKQ